MFSLPEKRKVPHFPSNVEMNDLIRDFNLSQRQAELLLSRLKEWNLVDKDVSIPASTRKLHERFSVFHSTQNEFYFCHDITGLFDEMRVKLIVSEWRLFIDSSSRSLKCVLLHIGNELPSIPIAHAVHKKEDYMNVKFVLDLIKYNEYKWLVCEDFKIIGFLKGLQDSYTKHSYYICLWDSRADSVHYRKKDWPLINSAAPGQNNIKYAPLVDSDKVLMPPLHIKLGLVK